MIKRSIVTTTVQSQSLPSTLLDGAKTNISSTAAKLSGTAVTLTKGIMLRLDSLGTGGTYVKVGNATTQSLKMLTAVGDMVFVDWINDISSIYVISDCTGSDAAVSYNGG